jgi:hypothetical protein
VSATSAGRALRALALGVLTAAAVAPAAHAGRVAVVVVGPFAPSEYAGRGAVGLLVPGAGSTVTRAGALSSLVRGKVVSSLLGGKATGPTTIRLVRHPGPVTIYVSLPPPGRSHNTRRYPIAIVGGGYRGLLLTDTTRIPGLVSVADVAPTAISLEHGAKPRIRPRADPDAPRTLTRLDTRLRRAHDARTAATVTLVAVTLVLAGLGLVLRSGALARAGLLAIPSALTVALALSAAEVSRPGKAIAVLAIGTMLVALVAGAHHRVFLPALTLFLVFFLVALTLWPDVSALSVIGPHPDGGGRYYGVTNEVETLLLAPILAAAAVIAPRALLLPLAAIALALVGWSRAGADGGGIVVVLVALGALWLMRERIRLTPAKAAMAIVSVIVVAVAIVGADALTGGSSHVTSAVGGGPGSLVGDLAHRLRISWKGVVATTQARITAGATLCALVGVGLRRPRIAVVDALLIGLVASLLVNDTPTDVLAFGALAAAALGAWVVVDPRATRRSGEGAYLRASPRPPLR